MAKESQHEKKGLQLELVCTLVLKGPSTSDPPNPPNPPVRNDAEIRFFDYKTIINNLKWVEKTSFQFTGGLREGYGRVDGTF